MRSIDEVIQAVCRMPLDYQGSARPIDLLTRSGYLDHRGEITSQHLEKCLDQRLIEAWQDWSDEKRTTPAWYLKTLGPGRFEVGQVDKSGKTTTRTTFTDRRHACAEFILRDIEQMADSIEFWKGPWNALRRRLPSVQR